MNNRRNDRGISISFAWSRRIPGYPAGYEPCDGFAPYGDWPEIPRVGDDIMMTRDKVSRVARVIWHRVERGRSVLVLLDPPVEEPLLRDSP